MDFITTSRASRRCGVARTTLTKWIDQGLLRAFLTPGGHRKIAENDLIEFMERQGIRQQSIKAPMKERILVVDDNPDDIRLLEGAFLAAAGEYEVQSADNGFHAIYKIGRFKPGIVILDLVMPDMDGFAVCEKIKTDQEMRNIKIIAVTAYSDKTKEERAYRCGVDAFFRKPVDLKGLVKKVLELRGRRA